MKPGGLPPAAKSVRSEFSGKVNRPRLHALRRNQIRACPAGEPAASSGLAVRIEQGIIATVKTAMLGSSHPDPAGKLAAVLFVPALCENDSFARDHHILRPLRSLFIG